MAVFHINELIYLYFYEPHFFQNKQICALIIWIVMKNKKIRIEEV